MLPNVGPVQFFKETVAELKKVTWPTREETIRYTFVVLAISVIVGVFIGGLDVVILKLTSTVLKR